MLVVHLPCRHQNARRAVYPLKSIVGSQNSAPTMDFNSGSAGLKVAKFSRWSLNIALRPAARSGGSLTVPAVAYCCIVGQYQTWRVSIEPESYSPLATLTSVSTVFSSAFASSSAGAAIAAASRPASVRRSSFACSPVKTSMDPTGMLMIDARKGGKQSSSESRETKVRRERTNAPPNYMYFCHVMIFPRSADQSTQIGYGPCEIQLRDVFALLLTTYYHHQTTMAPIRTKGKSCLCCLTVVSE